jgi:lysophospholipase L1-like esterase
MRLRRRGPAWWAAIAAAVCVLLLGLAVVVAVTGDEPTSRATAADSPALSAARTAGTATEGARESRSAERTAMRTRATTTDSPEAPSSSSPSTTSPSGSTSLPARTPVVTFLGDSWTVGYGSEQERGYTVLAGEELGWAHHALGVGGSGYLQSGTGAPFADRVAAAAATGADVVVVQGSLNDQRSDIPALGPAALDTLAALRAAVSPGTAILVIGAPYTPGTDRAAIDAINDAVGGAATSLGLRFVDPAVENWNDPADPAIWADADHPNDAGYRLVADHVSELLQETAQG